MNSDQPNILFLFTDQQRFDTIASLGNTIIRTPALDHLVHHGTTFTRAYTPNPVCMAARCSLSTGLPCHLTGVTDNIGIPSGMTSLMERLRDGGYQTHGVGKMHFDPDYKRAWGFESRDISEEGPDDTDFRDYLARNGYGHVAEINGLRSEYYYIPQPSQLPARHHETRWVGDRSIDFLKRRDRNRPFFLWSSFIKPHPPFENPVPWNRLYRTTQMPLPFRPEGYEEMLTLWNHVQNRYKYRDAGFDDLLLRTMRAAYYASISFIDQQIGHILDTLTREELDNTLIVFSSDHGELLGDYGSVGKRSMLDAACRVPLIACWPGHFKANVRCSRPATLLDLFPTFLTAAGLDDCHPSKEGCDLGALARGEADRPFVFSQFSERHTGLYMVTDNRWKYSYSAADEKEWLVDLKTNPLETRNLATNPEFGETLARMRQVCIDRFHADGYESALDGDSWRRYGIRTLPKDNPDYGLLLQDRPNLQELINGLGAEYARKVTVSESEAYRILLDLQHA